MSENTKALCLFIMFFVVMGCAGNGDYEYRKHQESKTNAQVKMCK